MARTFRRTVDVTVRLSIAAGVTLADAKAELKTRVNRVCSHSIRVAESDVQIARITKCPN